MDTLGITHNACAECPGKRFRKRFLRVAVNHLMPVTLGQGWPGSGDWRQTNFTGLELDIFCRLHRGL
jgi:hypothetical protein